MNTFNITKLKTFLSFDIKAKVTMMHNCKSEFQELLNNTNDCGGGGGDADDCHHSHLCKWASNLRQAASLSDYQLLNMAAKNIQELK
jgi:hypothetical protein